MPRILLVKTSSLGDIVHNLPVASDIAANVPGAAIEWVAEEAFAAIPALHPAVQRVIPIAFRRWRNSWSRAETRAQVQAFVRGLREHRYDAVIDTQGLLKSALVARAAHGTRYGLDWRSSREPLAVFYDHVFRIPRELAAVKRNRLLAGQALGYSQSEAVEYGISAPSTRFPWLPTDRYSVLLHATSARAKLWPDERWIALGAALCAQGLRTVLPWGTEGERERSLRLSEAIEGSIVPPALPLVDAASVLAHARSAIGVDTGLTHLAGALGVATVGIYTATDPALTGLYGCRQGLNVGGRGHSPSTDEVLRALEPLTR